MKTSIKGIIFIKRHEGLKLFPYKCSAGTWTIGYGSTYYEDNRPVTHSDMPITELRADMLLKNTLTKFESRFTKRITEVGLQLTQNEFDACISFLYNLGIGLLSVERTFGQAVKLKDKGAIAAAIPLYNKVNGTLSNGLYKRRMAEQKLFLGE